MRARQHDSTTVSTGNMKTETENKFYITTPIYYVNDKPHVGHIYTTIAADVLALYRRMRGDEVFFLTGTDENSQKNTEAAAKLGYEDIGAYLDMMSGLWRDTFVKMGISNDDFIRTTEERHKKGVEKFWHIVRESGDIYEGEYEGMYCAGCEAFKLEGDLVDGLCPLHKKAPQAIKEKNYFFRLSAYRERLLAHIDEHADFIQPLSRRNEVRSYVENFMEDVSISRDVGSVKCGIPVPGDATQVIYVWFDALINYLTGVDFGTDEARFKKWWPADVHLVGKDIIKFHCALWPAMLMSAGMSLPEKVFAHGFFTIDGDKMSKSLGNAIDPLEITEKYGRDALRYFLLREITFGEDGDFSMRRLGERYSGDLANELGNLLHRTLAMAEKYTGGEVARGTEGAEAGEGAEGIVSAWDRYEAAMERLDFGGALETVWEILRASNKLVDDSKPWALAKEGKDEELREALYILLERLRHVAWMLRPFMPETSVRMLEQLGCAVADDGKGYEDVKHWGGLAEGTMIAKGEPLFPRLEE